MVTSIGHSPPPFINTSLATENTLTHPATASSPHSAPATPTHAPASPNTIERQRERGIAKNLYNELRAYHGTSKDGKTSIQTDGMRISNKIPGATSELEKTAAATGEELDPGIKRRSDEANFVTKDLEVAMQYAVTGREEEREKAAVVRILVDYKPMGMKPDLDSGTRSNNMKTTQDIPKGFVLRRGENPAEANELFHRELGVDGLETSEGRAKELLKEVQSDSEGEEELNGLANAPSRA